MSCRVDRECVFEEDCVTDALAHGLRYKEFDFHEK